ILATQDGGATWTRQFEDREREAPLLDIWFRDTQYGLAVGAYGALLETRNGGRTWQDISDRLDNEEGLHLNGIAAVKQSGLVIVGEMGALYRSADWGETWERLESPYEGTLFGALGTARSGTLLIYGLRGNLYRSADFGDSWRPVSLRDANGELAFGLNGGTLLADGSLVLVGHGGSILHSEDEGRSFTVFNRPDRLSLSAVADDGAGRLVLVGHGGSSLHSEDDGRSFTVFNRPDRLSLSAVADDGAGRLVLVGQGGIHALGLPAAKLADAVQKQ